MIAKTEAAYVQLAFVFCILPHRITHPFRFCPTYTYYVLRVIQYNILMIKRTIAKTCMVL